MSNRNSPIIELTIRRKTLKFNTKMAPLKCLQILLLSLLLNPIFIISGKKLPHQRRLKSLSPEQMLKEYSESPLPANTSYVDLETNIASWTGARIRMDKVNMDTMETTTKLGIRRRKTKSGLLIERNTPAPEDPQQQQQQHQQRQHKKARNEKQQRRQRNGRNGQANKLQRNALRLLDSGISIGSGSPSASGLLDHGLPGIGIAGGLFPPLFNVAPRAVLTVNATCGQHGAEEYCKLVDAYPHRNWAKQCGTCNAHSSDVAKQRPIESVISNSNFDESWWQSPTLQGGRQYEYVTITLDLKQIYQVFFVMLKSANSPRPASWILEKSLDGTNYEPWQYFGLSDTDCRRRYGLPGQNGKYIFQHDTEIICTTQFSKALPLENGELHVSLLKNRPGAADQTQDVLNFITARFIRIRLQGMHSTANLDNSVDWLLDAQSLEKRSFYSLKQIRVSARLDCHGHADHTVEQAAKNANQDMDTTSADSTLQCVCQHNTCGTDCSTCCPLFQDKPFRNGTRVDAYECEVCQCNGHAESCYYDAYLDRGICVDCRNQTAGSECEFCLKGYYRAEGAPPSEPCLPCACNERSSTGDCATVGGICHCKDGFQGPRCEECAPGYFGDDCRRCECDVRGTYAEAICSSNCACKPNVDSPTCDTCLPGYFNLDATNPEGCTACWCSDVGVDGCQSAQLQTLAFETLTDWWLTDITRSLSIATTLDTDANKLIFSSDDLTEVEAIYWQAPRGYLGNKLTSYGSRLSMQVSWITIRGDTSGEPTSGPNVILFGSNGIKIGYGDDSFGHASSAIINVTLHESGWYHVPLDVHDIKTRLRRTEYHGSPVTRAQMLSVLVSIEAMLIRGAYHTDQVETSLERAIIFSGGTELGGHAAMQVEQCRCPSGYTGLSCEGCAFGYKRIYENTSEHQVVAKCIPCPCNGHSNSCDLQSGNCGDCMHNTYGDRCERCQIGYYGNPMQGTPHDCKRCACPLLLDSNNFSPSCQLKTYSIVDINPQLGLVEHAEYICTQCPPGYTGDHCQICDDGYYGKPTEVGSQCLPCECDGGPCDGFSGACITCHGNTEGWHCERCKLGYWGDPAVGCLPCDCYEDGAESGLCDSTDGQCLCKPRIAGQKCDECAPGYANIDLKCLPCNCDPMGSLYVDTCDPDNGQCTCKFGVVGLNCNECADGHFSISTQWPDSETTTTPAGDTEFNDDEIVFVDGWELATPEICEDCQCSQVGAISTICEKRTGQCSCHANVTGRRCDKCKPGHWNLTQGIGCQNCRCDPAGSRSNECNPWTGQCDCKIGVGGQHCNECTDGFFGFAADGCQRCAACASEGQVCDPLNGRCICPKNTRGLGCAQCIPGTWGWQARLGCKPCDCDYIGSIGQQCATGGGQCQCREGYAGRKCDSCAVGYFGYPECRRCSCDPDGSFIRSDGVIACDANGQCPCKSLVVGLKCDTCMQSTFGLSALNPEGCTRCFCFGRSVECEQSEWSWGHIRMSEARNLSVQYVRPQNVPNTEYEYIVVVQMATTVTSMVSSTSTYHAVDAEISQMNDLNLIPRSMGNVSIGAYGHFYHPLYFQLPPQFYGDRTSSYGGYLYFTLLTEGAHTPLERKVLAQYPLVQLHSHTKLVLDFYEYEIFEYALNVTYKVALHESYWKYHHNSQAVDRATLMAALQNVKHIFVRGFTFADFTQVVLQNVHMDSAIFVYGSTNMIAKGVERCKCPKRFDGLSCQDPGRGFYRWRNVTEIETVFIEDLIGRAAPCHCNGRSNECDRETGSCLHCRDNTGGPHCEQCAEGFYGDPNSPHGCQSCPCPETNRNFARGCNVYDNEVSCICKLGYAGRLCDRCRSGYFGNPMAYPNSTCEPCGCNANGISAEGCDPKTGQCFCREGVMGLKCDKCRAERQHLVESGCRICDSCTLLLLDYTELIANKLRRGLHNMDLTGIPAPYLKVAEYEAHFNTLNIHYHDYNNARQLLTSFDAGALLKMDSHAENVKFQSRKAVSTIEKRQHAIGVLNDDSLLLCTDVGGMRADILQTLFDLNNYGKGAQHMSLPTALKQASFYLESIRQHQQSVDHIRLQTSCAWHHFYFFGNASDAAFDQQARVEMFWRELNQTNFRLSDMRLITDRTLEIQSEIEDTLEHIKNLKSYVVEDYIKINELRDSLVDKLNQRYLTDATSILDLNLNRQNELAMKINGIVRTTALLNASLAENEHVQRDVRKHWLPKAEKHAMRLLERSNEYARQFQPTRNAARFAMLASSAHKNISDAIDAARQASFEARERAFEAQRTLYPPDGSSMIERARFSSNKSKQLQRSAVQEMQRTDVLKEHLRKNEQKVERITSRILDAGIGTNNISLLLQGMLNSEAARNALESIQIAKTTSDAMRTEQRKTHGLQRDINKLREKFAILEPDWEIKLGMAEENISLTKTNLRLANLTLSFVEEQSHKDQVKFETLNNTVSQQLQELRDKIAKARHAADGIKISMESMGPKCVRSYLPTSYGLTTSNTIKLSFALSSHMGNSPLLYIQGTEGRFISLELFKRHVRLIWQLGGTTATITHPLEIQTLDPKYDEAWYHVEANRTLNIGSLLVRRMNNFGELIHAAPITGNTDLEHTRFFQTRHERIHLGGYPSNVRNKELQLSPGLNVVIHKLEVDNKPIGVWNFMTSEGRCGGAVIGAQESTVSSAARHFNGLGYAEVKKTRPRPYRKTLFALQMTFRTLDENALLFLAVDDKNNRSVSVTLSRGRIMFRIDYGDESKLEINTTNKYNTGQWVKIDAAREFSPKRGTENGMLRVNNDRSISGAPTVPIKSHMLPDLSKTIYYLGGVPPGFTSGTTKAPGADNPFLGCMMDVQVNGESYDPLESSTYFGVEPSCKDMITKVGFTGNGYLELPSQSLRKRSNTGLVFRTQQPNCLLLLAGYPPEVQNDYDAKDIKGNYSISLIDGHIQVWLNSGRSFIKLSSNATLNDGEFHVINLIKNGRKFELMVDDELHDTRSFSGSPTVVSMPREAGGLYIGGAPPYEEYTPLAPTFIKLEGAVRDVVFNNRTVNFNQALNFVNAQIGRNGPLMGSVNGVYDVLLKTEPMIGKSFTAAPEGCKRIGSYSYEPNAFKFGDEPYSYAQLKLPDRNFWQHNFHITFDFRSFYPNGLIYLSPGAKDKKKHYVALLLKDGQLLLIVRGRRREELQLTAKLNDGEWHRVTISCHERKVTLSVEIGKTDQKTSAQMKVPKKIATSQLLLVGGLPETPPKVPTELYVRLESFKGCLRRVTINNSTQDLARPGKHLNVGQCFPKVERGSYFPGDAFAIYKKNFHVGKYLELEMEFRTSELAGILLSISEPTGFPALSLELNNGNIIFSCDLGDGVPFRVESLLPNKYALCDNKWHNISALYDYEQIALRIDQLPAMITVSPQHTAGKVQTKSPLYIGGIPDIAPSGSLLSRENFKGCIRNVSIRNERRDWIDMDGLHNVLLSECLISSLDN